MPAAIIGNSRMLACLRKTGELSRLFWPDIDYGQHLGDFLTGINLAAPEQKTYTLWFHRKNWQAGQRYLEGANVLETVYLNNLHRLKVTQTDFVLPDEDTLVRRYVIENLGTKLRNPVFFTYCGFRPEESNLYDNVYFDYTNNSLVFFRRNVYLTVAASGQPLAGFHCGRRGTPSDPYQEASRGRLWGSQDNMLKSAGSLAWKMGELAPEQSREISLYLIAGPNREDNQERLKSLLATSPSEQQDLTVKHWQGFLCKSPPDAAEAKEKALYIRSLLAMQLMTNSRTGASIAAPEFDPCYQM
ncbi:MAG: hypothetical protein K6U74_12765 [Firmicutes bacterium]|nr:hypothetical protein [Bacillota bacterium]